MIRACRVCFWETAWFSHFLMCDIKGLASSANSVREDADSFV